MRHGHRRRTWPTVWLFLLLPPIAPAATAAEQVASPLPELVLIAPGTQVVDGPPQGWTDLIIKSVPKLESGDLDTLPSFAGSTATLFRMTVLADVRKTGGDRPRYRLARIGVGLCTPTKGNDTIVTCDYADSEAVSLGLIERKVLERVEEELKKARLVARTERFAVLAAPSELVVEGRHEKIFLFYALSVDPDTGRLNTILWAYTSDPERKVRLSPPALLPPRLVYRCGLDVEAERLLGALPINWSFAMRALPPGSRVEASDQLRAWLIDPRRMAADPGTFETSLRALVVKPANVTRAGRTPVAP